MVPLESIFHAVANGKQEVVVQCCEIISSSDALANVTLPLERLVPSMKRALARLGEHERHSLQAENYPLNPENYPTHAALAKKAKRAAKSRNRDHQKIITKREEFNRLNLAYSRIHELIEKTNTTRERQYSPCDIDLEVIYPSADDKPTLKRDVKCCKAPMTLLIEGRKEINRISEDLITEQSGSTKGCSASNANTMMLGVINGLRKDFETCSTLLGAFMESQARIPLERARGDKYVNKIAKHASSLGLSVWALLILPFTYLNQLMVSNVSEGVRKIVIDFSRQIDGFRRYMFRRPASHFPNYDEKMEFLVGSMKESTTCNNEYISYSLERQLEDQCTKRNLFHDTPIDEILDQWNDNFENETLTLVPSEYRRLVARWIKWSLMINNLRESLASQTAIGVIGLVNSGKSKFVRTMFGKEVSQ